jgi:hypothetical protein
MSSVSKRFKIRAPRRAGPDKNLDNLSNSAKNSSKFSNSFLNAFQLEAEVFIIGLEVSMNFSAVDRL